jgi:hypothetical protein
MWSWLLFVGWYTQNFPNCQAPIYSFYPKLCNYFISLLQSSNIEIVEETCGRVVKQKTHDREVLGSNPRWGDHYSCTIHLDQIMETYLITWHCCTVACAVCNLANGRVDFVDVGHIYLHQGNKNAFWVDSWPIPKSNGRGENHLGRRAPSSHTSLYKLP